MHGEFLDLTSQIFSATIASDSMVNIQFDGVSMESAPPIFTPKFVSPALTAEAMPCIYYSNQDSMVNIQLDGLSIESAPPIFTPEFVSPALTAEAMTYV